MLDRLDHLVLTCTDEARTIAFYTEVLGMELVNFESRKALHFGRQKINLHVRGHEYEPRAHIPAPGALDLCFIADRPLDTVIAHLHATGTPLIEGPVHRTGAAGPLRSVYLRDPDLNLIEISELLPKSR